MNLMDNARQVEEERTTTVGFMEHLDCDKIIVFYIFRIFATRDDTP